VKNSMYIAEEFAHVIPALKLLKEEKLFSLHKL
jgi:hypothetical protein